MSLTRADSMASLTSVVVDVVATVTLHCHVARISLPAVQTAATPTMPEELAAAVVVTVVGASI